MSGHTQDYLESQADVHTYLDLVEFSLIIAFGFLVVSENMSSGSLQPNYRGEQNPSFIQSAK